MKIIPPPKKKKWSYIFFEDLTATRWEHFLGDVRLVHAAQRYIQRLPPIVVRKRDNLLVTGRERFAKWRMRKLLGAKCVFVECADEEIEALYPLDSARGQKTQAETHKVYLEVFEDLFNYYEQHPEDGRVKDYYMRGSGVRAKLAMEICTSITPKAMDVNITRARGRRQGKRYDQWGKIWTHRKIETWGLELDENWLLQMSEYDRCVTSVTQNLHSAMRAVTLILNKELPCTPEDMRECHRVLKETSDYISTFRAWALCPHCKGQPQFQPACKECRGRGFAYTSQRSRAPAQLLTAEPCMVQDPETGKLIEIGTDGDEEFLGEEADDPIEALL